MDDAILCPHCGGDGFVTEYEQECCGNYLPTGECCAAMHGTAYVQVVPYEVQCQQCGGSGEVERYR